jgi:hypothetical protein
MASACMQVPLCCGSARANRLLDYWSVMPTGLLLLALFWIIFAPTFYWRIFLPCWDCYDFEGTLAHEVGLIAC